MLVRHGETTWSASGRHTGRTDVGLTDAGREQARSLRAALARWDFALALTSPLTRASETARLVGVAPVEVEERLVEWDYGAYEGITTPQIRETVPGWTVWTHPVPNGEDLAAVGARVDGVLERLRAADGHVLLVAHGHLLRALAARWLGLPARHGAQLVLGTATLSVLGHDHEAPALERWNVPPEAAPSVRPPPP